MQLAILRSNDAPSFTRRMFISSRRRVHTGASRSRVLFRIQPNADYEVSVSWQWSGSRPGGTVAEVAKEGELSIETKNGNTVKKNADAEDPAVKISRSGNDVVKRAHELDVEEAGDKHKEDKGEEKTVSKDDKEEDDETKDEDDKKDDKKEEKEEEKKESGKGGQKKKPAAKAKTGDKRQAKDDGEDEKASKKQQKTDDAGEENGDKKKRGRPAKNGNEASSSSKPKKEPKKAATQSGEPRRSTRLNSS
jgi:hypothetical protein